MRGGDNFTFAQVPTADIPRSTFNRSHGHKTTFNSGYLIPIYVDEALPGDTFQVNASVFARLATPIAPIMDNLHMEFFFFAVPNRLVWDKWQRFCGEQPNPGDSTDFVVPYVYNDNNSFGPGSLFDYFGVPPLADRICAFWSRAYSLIYNEWFRDENLCARAAFTTGDGFDNGSSYVLKKRGKRHDYFTSCLPWPQKGEGVTLPLAGYANVLPGSGGVPADIGPTFRQTIPTLSVGPLAGEAGTSKVYHNVPATASNNDLQWAEPNLLADLTNTTAVTINSLRQAFQIQKLLERDARGGTRYVEILRSHFGVVSPDARLQRPEYLGGGSVNVNVNPVAQTSASGTYADTPQGNLAAYGTAGGSGIGFSKSFVEHCVIIGLVCVRADLSYQQGLHRMFSRSTRYDFYWPAFAHLGEQAVLSKEIYCDGTAADDDVFGYQERWAEYRYFPSKITGKFRSSDPQSLDFWHLAQEFTTRPVLSEAFIQENPPVDRVVAVTTEPQFIFDSHWSIKCTRPMPTYSVPGLIDHF